MNKYDVIIIGSGPVGLSLAKSLSNESFSVCVIDRQTKEDLSNPAYDGREVAITHFSKNAKISVHGTSLSTVVFLILKRRK